MNKSLFGSKRAKTICALMTVIIFTGIIGMTSKAQTERRASNIKSKGIFDYDNGTVVVDASDLTYLADEIDLLEETYKKETVKALNKMSTYFMMNNSTTHDPDESNLDPESSVILPFGSIIDGILASQSIPTEKTYTGTLPGEENETTGNISAATVESISLGTAAWVDGELIIGTGADNYFYYATGYTDGLNEKLNGISISYEYHTHSGNSTTGGGCYTKAVHNHTDSCSVKYGTHHIVETNHYDGSSRYMECEYCGIGGYKYNTIDGEEVHPGDWGTCTKHIVEYTCGSPVQYYALGCGKDKKTIESATINFNN